MDYCEELLSKIIIINTVYGPLAQLDRATDF